MLNWLYEIIFNFSSWSQHFHQSTHLALIFHIYLQHSFCHYFWFLQYIPMLLVEEHRPKISIVLFLTFCFCPANQFRHRYLDAFQLVFIPFGWILRNLMIEIITYINHTFNCFFDDRIEGLFQWLLFVYRVINARRRNRLCWSFFLLRFSMLHYEFVQLRQLF